MLLKNLNLQILKFYLDELNYKTFANMVYV